MVDQVSDACEWIGGNKALVAEHFPQLPVVLSRELTVVRLLDDDTTLDRLPDAAAARTRHGPEQLLLGPPEVGLVGRLDLHIAVKSLGIVEGQKTVDQL